MKLSTKGRYAARAMLELANSFGSGPLQLHKIAEQQDISVRYLERLMGMMVSTGLVRSVRGPRGGFQLTRSPSEIKLSTVVVTAEGSLAPVDCVDMPEICDRCETCVTRDIWSSMKDAILGVLDAVTLEDMQTMQIEKNKQLTIQEIEDDNRK